MEYLLSKGVDVNQQDLNDLYPLFMACYVGNLNILKYLLEHGANPRLKGPKSSTAIHSAADRDFPELCRAIIEKDPEVMYDQDIDGNTPMHAAALWSHVKCMEIMFEFGGERLVNIKNNDGENSVDFAYGEN